MKRVIVTVGPRGAGKTFFCQKAIETYRTLRMVSRDAILTELFGCEWTNPNRGKSSPDEVPWKVVKNRLAQGLEVMWERVSEQLQADEITLILDCWNDTSDERTTLVQKLRSLGAESVVAWYFTTPVGVAVRWYLGKSQSQPVCPRKFEMYLDTYIRYHKAIKSPEGFDAFIAINPLVTTPRDVLALYDRV